MEETTEFLIAKREGVKDCVKHLEREIKKEQKYLLHDENMKRQLGHFEDCGEGYVYAVEERKARIKALVEQKISLEKYAKKLQHMADESMQRKPLVIGELYSYEDILLWHKNVGYRVYGTSYRTEDMENSMFQLIEVEVSQISNSNYHKFHELKQLQKQRKKDEQIKIHLMFIRRLISAYRQQQAIPPLVLDLVRDGYGIIDGSHRTSALDHIGRPKTLAFIRIGNIIKE